MVPVGVPPSPESFGGGLGPLLDQEAAYGAPLMTTLEMMRRRRPEPPE